MAGKSLDILMGINKNKEDKNTNIQTPKNLDSEEPKSKRSYNLKHSTIKKLEEMKVYMFPVNTELSDIVDEAICKLYELKKEGN